MKTLFEQYRVSAGIIYLLIITYFLFFAPFRADTLTEVNLIPFKILLSEVKPIFTDHPSWEYIFFIIGGMIGNILLLLPVPVLFKLKWPASLRWSLILLLPISIESLQFVFQVGSADIDDVLLNSLGCWIGFGLANKL